MDGKGDTYDGRYYAPVALEKIVPASSENMAELERRALARALKAGIEPGDPQFDQWWDANKPRPAGIPPHVIEKEIAHPGSTRIVVTTDAKGDVLDVRPR